MLCRWGSHVKTTNSFHDLVETLKFKTGKVDLVLMDAHMPDGLELEEVVPIVKENLSEATMVIGTTTKWTPQLRDRCIASGMKELFVKPFQQKDIENALNGFLSCDKDENGNPKVTPADAVAISNPVDVPKELEKGPDTQKKSPKSPKKAKEVKEINVLCADDNPTSLKFAFHILSLLGCKVHCATCGEQAAWMIRGISFDIIYMDLHMPGMNGYEATRWIRNELPVHQRPSILAITGDTSSGVTRRCINAGMEGYITKPPSKDKFALSLVQTLVRPGMRPGIREALAPCIRAVPGGAGIATKPSPLLKWLPQIDSWDFDPYKFCARNPVQMFCELGMEVLRSHGILEEFNISYEKLTSYLSYTAMKYSTEVPYHNLVHACSVVQAMHFFLKADLGKELSKFEILVVLFVCIVQNIDHPGVNSAFVKQATAQRGNDIPFAESNDHILERHHVNISFTALQMPQLDFLSGMPEEQLAEFKEVCTELILVTDMNRHAEVISEYIQRKPELNFETTEDRLLLMKLAVKCADMATPAMDVKVYAHSAELFFQELHAQGDRERAEGLPISPLCDRSTFNMVDAQRSIMSLMLLPMFDCFADMLESETIRNTCVKQLQKNIEQIPQLWKS